MSVGNNQGKSPKYKPTRKEIAAMCAKIRSERETKGKTPRLNRYVRVHRLHIDPLVVAPVVAVENSRR